jgi:hypothetical protein
MVDFCKDCSIEMWGKDTGDFADIAKPGENAFVLCEGCGYIWVDSEGQRINLDEPK